MPNSDGTSTVTLHIGGPPGSGVRLWLEGEERVYDVVIGESGTAALVFSATDEQFQNHTTVYLAYRAGETLGDVRMLYLVP